MVGGFAIRIMKEEIAIHTSRNISLSYDLDNLRWLYLEGKNKKHKSTVDTANDIVYLVEEKRGTLAFGY